MIQTKNNHERTNKKTNIKMAPFKMGRNTHTKITQGVHRLSSKSDSFDFFYIRGVTQR